LTKFPFLVLVFAGNNDSPNKKNVEYLPLIFSFGSLILSLGKSQKKFFKKFFKNGDVTAFSVVLSA